MMNSQRTDSLKAFSLVELLVVLVVLSLLVTVIWSLLINGWRAADDSMIRSQLQMEANLIAERLTADSLGADRAELNEDSRELTLFDAGGGFLVRYAILQDGGTEGWAAIGVEYPGLAEPRILSGYVRFADSVFEFNGRYLRLNLVLVRSSFNREISMISSMEVFLRN